MGDGEKGVVVAGPVRRWELTGPAGVFYVYATNWGAALMRLATHAPAGDPANYAFREAPLEEHVTSRGGRDA